MNEPKSPLQPKSVPKPKAKWSFEHRMSPDINELTLDEEKKMQRQKRFQQEIDERERKKRVAEMVNHKARMDFLAAGSEGNPDVIDWDEYTIVGTCPTLEKRYLRLTSVCLDVCIGSP